MSNVISIGEASRISGLSCRRLRYLEEYGYLKPQWQEIGGGRRIRVYDEKTLEKLKRIVALMRQGFPPRVAAEKVEHLAEGSPTP